MYNSEIQIDLSKVNEYNITLPTNNIKNLYLNISNNTIYRVYFLHNNKVFFSVNPLTDFSFLLPDTARDQITIRTEQVITKSFISNNILNIQLSDISENYNQNYINYELYNYMTLPTYIFQDTFTGINPTGYYIIQNGIILQTGESINNYVKQLKIHNNSSSYNCLVNINNSTNFSIGTNSDLDIPVQLTIDSIHIKSASSTISANVTVIYC